MQSQLTDEPFPARGDSKNVRKTKAQMTWCHTHQHRTWLYRSRYTGESLVTILNARVVGMPDNASPHWRDFLVSSNVKPPVITHSRIRRQASTFQMPVHCMPSASSCSPSKMPRPSPSWPPRRRTDDHCKPAPVVTYQAVGFAAPDTCSIFKQRRWNTQLLASSVLCQISRALFKGVGEVLYRFLAIHRASG